MSLGCERSAVQGAVRKMVICMYNQGQVVSVCLLLKSYRYSADDSLL